LKGSARRPRSRRRQRSSMETLAQKGTAELKNPRLTQVQQL
jgi:hypothetical protein